MSTPNSQSSCTNCTSTSHTVHTCPAPNYSGLPSSTIDPFHRSPVPTHLANSSSFFPNETLRTFSFSRGPPPRPISDINAYPNARLLLEDLGKWGAEIEKYGKSIQDWAIECACVLTLPGATTVNVIDGRHVMNIELPDTEASRNLLQACLDEAKEKIARAAVKIEQPLGGENEGAGAPDMAKKGKEKGVTTGRVTKPKTPRTPKTPKTLKEPKEKTPKAATPTTKRAKKWVGQQQTAEPGPGLVAPGKAIDNTMNDFLTTAAEESAKALDTMFGLGKFSSPT